MTAPVIETERLILRAPEGRDFEGWAAFMATDRARWVGGPQGRDQAWRSFCHIVGHRALRGFSFFVWSFRGDDAARGTAGPWFPEGWPEREIGWSVWDGAHEGRGYVREAAEAARAWIWRELGWPEAVSYIWRENLRSVALAERLGARLDPAAKTPGDNGEVVVYRHARPEARA